MPTLEMVKEAWKRFEGIKDAAEQHQFSQILFWDAKLTPLYNNLLAYWDDHHAEIFLKGMDIMFQSLGCSTMAEYRKENKL